MKNNKFVFVVPVFNASKTIKQMLLSVVAQSYDNWRIMIRDDMSTDDTCDKIDALIKQFGITDRVSFVRNTEKMWEVRNILEMLKECKGDEIVCRLDGDDWLTDLDALAFIDHVYRTTGFDVVWTDHRWDYTSYNISGDLPKNVDPYKHSWVSSHFKTFRKYLIEGVKDENFRGSDGEYFKRIGDQAIYLPVLHQAKGNWARLPLVTYHYTIDLSPQTFQTEDARFQRDEALFLRERGFLS